MAYHLGIDLGTTYTAAAIERDGLVEALTLGNRSASVPSVVFLRDDGEVLVGEAATRRAVTEPGRVGREFKRRVGDPTPIILGGTPYAAEMLMARMLRWAVDRAQEQQGGPARGLALTHPANWGPYKLDLLAQAVRQVDVSVDLTLPEPVAAATFYASQRRLDPGAVVAVYDLGGGTFDAAMVRRHASGSGGFEIIGTPEGIERLGGIDFDEAVFAHVRSAIGDALELLDPDEPTSVSAMTRLRQECIDAKEALSGDTDVSIPVLLPNLQTEVRLTRSEFEDMIRPAINETIVALRRAIRSAGVADGDISAVLLVGGSSRIPLVAQMVTAEIGRPVAIDAHPKDAIAFGAAIAVAQQTGQATPESVTTVLPDRTSEVSSPRPPDVVAPGRMPPTPAAPPVVPVAPAAGQPAPGVPGVGQSVPGPGAPGSLVPPAQRPAAALGNAAVAPPPGGPALQATPGAFAPPAGPAGAPPIAARQDQVPEWVGQGATTHMPAVGSPPPSVHVPNPGQGPAPVSPVGGMPAQRPGPYGSPPGGMPPLRPSSSRSSGGSDRTLQVIAVGVVAAMLFIVLVALLVWRNEQKDGQSYTTNLQNDFVTACKTGVQENVCRCAIDKIVDEVPFEDFKAFADLRKEHPDAESPSWLTARVQACQDQLSGATSS